MGVASLSGCLGAWLCLELLDRAFPCKRLSADEEQIHDDRISELSRLEPARQDRGSRAAHSHERTLIHQCPVAKNITF